MPVVPAIQEAETGELLEPRRWRLQGAKNHTIALRPGWQSETLSQKQKQTNKKWMNTKWLQYQAQAAVQDF